MRDSVLVIALSALTICSGTNWGNAPRKVQVGYCAALSELEATKAAGFEYAELRTAEVAALSEADYEKLAGKVKQLGIPVPVTNYFIPASIKVTGPAIDQAKQMEYVKQAFDRVSRLGVGIIVFGSGGARQVPDGFSKPEAFEQLVEFCRRIAPEAKAHKLTIAIEPLRKEECNIINTAGEGLALVEAVHDPNIQLMVDFYHLAVEREDPQIIIKAKDHLRHLHMANPEGRVFPLKWEEYDYAKFFENLRKIGYDRRISVEAQAKDFQKEAPLSIALLRRAFRQ